MSERYWITGVQLGALTALILDEVINKQCIGNCHTDKEKKKFVKKIKKVFE